MTNNKSNFSFLSEHWAFLQSDARQVETYALRDPRAASIYARRTLEISLKWLFANDTALKRPYEKSLAAMIHEPTFAKNIRKGLFHDIKFIHRLGNIAVHGDQEISEQEGLKATVALHQFLGWLARVYTKGGAKPEQFHINQRSDRQDLSSLQPKKEITGRYYQMEAAARVMENFGAKRKRKSLIVMATGTGKTRLSITLVDMLMRAGWARKILFLADRVALVNQAKREFNSHLPHVTVASLLDKKQEDARVLFSTYPAMLNCIDGTKKDQKEIFSVAHFDLIIIDEAHRSVYQKYGAIFDYFDSLLLGLTATPRGEVDRNTYKLFQLEDHQPTYSYELEQAVEDKFLVPPRAISVPLKFQREGIKYNDLSPEEQEEYELQEQFYDQEGELKEEVSASALNQWLFNTDTVNKVLMHLMEKGIKVEGGDKLGKTIIFAKNTKHADFIVEQFDKNYPEMAGKFCRKVDYSVKYVQSLIDDFSIKDKEPYIVASVDMLDTGIDVPEVVNLVFFKLVRSKTKFWQMLGRGTRLCENLFAPGDNKKEFIIFDYCQNLEFFDAHPDGYESGVQESVKQKIFKRRLELSVALQSGEPDDEALINLGDQLKDQMHSAVDTMNLELHCKKAPPERRNLRQTRALVKPERR